MHVSEIKQYTSYFEDLWDSLGTGPAQDGWMESKDYSAAYMTSTNISILRESSGSADNGSGRPSLAGYLPENFVRPRTLAVADVVNAFDECLDHHRLSFAFNSLTLGIAKQLSWELPRPPIGNFIMGRINDSSSCDNPTLSENAHLLNGNTIKTEPGLFDFNSSSLGQASIVEEPESPVFELVIPPVSMPTLVAPKDLQMICKRRNTYKDSSENARKDQRSSNARMSAKYGTMYSGIEFETFVDLGRVLNNIARACEPADFEATLRRVSVALDVPMRCSNARTRGQFTSTEILRVRHHRPNFIEEMMQLPQGLNGLGYERNRNFKPQFPYEPEYVRYQTDPTTNQPLNHTRHGLCPYCFEIHFYHFKTLAYGQHLALFHGIYPSNYIAPDPLYGGLYFLRKLNSQNISRKRTAHEHIRPGVICPACFEILECDCTKTTKLDERPLTKYLRHFRDCHIKAQRDGSVYKLFQQIVHQADS